MVNLNDKLVELLFQVKHSIEISLGDYTIMSCIVSILPFSLLASSSLDFWQILVLVGKVSLFIFLVVTETIRIFSPYIVALEILILAGCIFKKKVLSPKHSVPNSHNGFPKGITYTSPIQEGIKKLDGNQHQYNNDNQPNNLYHISPHGTLRGCYYNAKKCFNKVGSYVYNALSKLARRKHVVNILKNITYVLVGFLAPAWFPVLQKLFAGGILTNTDWLTLLLFLVIPILGLWQCEKQEKRERISEQLMVFRQLFKEAGLIKK